MQITKSSTSISIVADKKHFQNMANLRTESESSLQKHQISTYFFLELSRIKSSFSLTIAKLHQN